MIQEVRDWYPEPNINGRQNTLDFTGMQKKSGGVPAHRRCPIDYQKPGMRTKEHQERSGDNVGEIGGTPQQGEYEKDKQSTAVTGAGEGGWRMSHGDT